MVTDIALGRPRTLGLVVQAGLPLLLETLSDALIDVGHEVLGTTTAARAAPELVLRLAPDVCLLHDVEPAASLEAAAVIRHRSPKVGIVVVCDEVSPQVRRAHDQHLVDAVVLDTSSFSLLASVLRRVARGERWLADGVSAAGDSRPGPALTPRERQILEHLVRGATTQYIARDLAISTHTVRSHVQGLTRKLGARGRARAVRAALSSDLLGSG